MEAKKKKFERGLKNKIQQKLKGKETEGSFLTKSFKFMDIYGTGKVNFEQFAGAIDRMGFMMERDVLVSPLMCMYRTCRASSPPTTPMATSSSTTASSATCSSPRMPRPPPQSPSCLSTRTLERTY